MVFRILGLNVELFGGVQKTAKIRQADPESSSAWLQVCKSEMETDTAAEGLREANVQLDKKVGNQHGLAIHIHGPSGRHSVLGTQPQQLGKPEESPIDDDEADPGHFIPANTCRLDTDVNETSVASSRGDGEEEVHNAWGGDDTDSKLEERATELEQARGIVVPSLQVPSTARDRLAKRRQRCQNNAETTSIASGASAADAPSESVMTRMMGGLPSWTMFSAANESEDEVHNAWGEQDTEEMLGQRALELQHARGIEIPGVPSESSAQARLAKRRHKAEAKRKAQLEVSGAGGGSHLFGNASSGMLPMLSSLTTVRAADAAQGGEDEVHNAWGGDDTDSKLEERATELEQARGIVVPSLQVPSTARDRLAKRRQRCQNNAETTSIASGASAADAPSESVMTRMMGGLPSWTMFSAANESEDEVHNAWGEQDTEEMLGQRALELQHARGIEIPGVPSESSAQARLAKRRHKAEAKRKAQLEVSGAGGGSHLFGNASSGMLSMLSSLTTVRAADAAQGDGEDEVHNAWGGDDTASKLEERATELEQARGIVVPSLQVPSTARDRLAKRRQRCQNNAETTSIASGASAADAPSESVMTRMMGGLPSWTMFSAANESEDEVHNAWGEQDTEEMLGQRALELQQARGIEIPGVPSESSAQARLAKRRHKAEAKRKAQLEVSGAGGGSHLFGNASSGMLSMLSSLTTVRAADAAQGDGEDEVHNAWGGDDTASKLEERATELEQARGIVVPSLQVPSTARDRLAKRRQRAQNDGHKCQEGADADAEEMTTSGRVKASFFAAAATSIMQFQSLFNLASDAEDEIDEVFCIWGDDDTPESYQDRVAAMEQARSEQSARLPHHRVIRQKRRGAANAEKKEP